MNKEEFLKQLEQLLADISEEERADAMAFYRSYFEDAGIGNEEKILAELESPEKVAEVIKRDLGMLCEKPEQGSNEGSEYTYIFTSNNQSNTNQYNANQNNANQNNTNSGYTNQNSTQYTSYNDSEEAKREKERKNNTILVLVIILGLLTSPAWLGALLGAIGTIFGLSIAIIAITFAMFVVGCALIGAGVGTIIGGTPIIGIGLFGASLLILAIAVLLLLADIQIFGRFLPWACKGIYHLCKKPFAKKEEAKAA